MLEARSISLETSEYAADLEAQMFDCSGISVDSAFRAAVEIAERHNAEVLSLTVYSVDGDELEYLCKEGKVLNELLPYGHSSWQR
jgi:hypothetical protein